MIPIALITLGAQLGRPRQHTARRELGAVTALRLAGGPAIAALIAWAARLPPEATASLVLASGAPTAVNITLLTLEFDTDPDFAATAVVWTTIASAATVTALLFLLRESVRLGG
jgi:predicted permease